MPVEYNNKAGYYTTGGVDETIHGGSIQKLRNMQRGFASNAINPQSISPPPTAAAATSKPGSQFDWSKLIDEYANSGFAKDLLPDNYGDNDVNTLATQQGSSLLGSLAAQRAGGQLSGVGYDAAMGNYNSQFDAAKGSIGQMSSGLIANDRQSLFDILGTARTDLDKMTDKSQFSLDPYKTKISDKANELKGGFHQSLLDSIGGANYFSAAPTAAAAAPAQGAFNRPSNGLLGSLEAQNGSSAGRGLGNGGDF